MRNTMTIGCALLAAAGSVQGAERSGEQVVKAQCVKCHGTGVNGAPKIDDRAAWAPRMRQGLEATVRSAIKGHGAMPARGGLADLTDSELRAAITYMFYPAGAAPRSAAAEPPAIRDAHLKVIDGMEVRLGIVPTQSKGSYRINISLRESATKADIKDAAVEARVGNALGGTTKKLDARAFNNSVSYGNDFRMQGTEPYTIGVQIRRPGTALPSEAKFEFRP